ncbi:MAG: Gfo/Idh/MocA family oxidoreductase [Bdellovibrionales bacterium]|nr:Gfo/Idh/MocA family oxidoreductase [Bdellovibrionales bacterium]
MSPAPLTTGILGFGHHARTALVPALQEAPAFRLHAIASRSTPSNGIGLAGNIEHVEDYERLIADPAVEVVIIATSNQHHAALAAQALALGKHVLCEKPLAVSASDIAVLEQATESSSALLLEGMMYRFHSQHRLVRSLVADNTIGPLRLFESHCHYYLADRENSRLRAGCAGGALNDVGCYPLDACAFVTGLSPRRLSGSLLVDRELGVDIAASFHIDLGPSAAAQIGAGCRLAPRANYYRLVGEKGTLTAEPAYKTPRNKKCRIRLDREDSSTRWYEVPPENQTSNMLQAFARWIRTGVAADAIPNDPLENARRLIAARAAAESAQVVSL